MTDPVLSDGQYSIGTPGSSSAFTYGGRVGSLANSILVTTTEMDTGSPTVQDQPVTGHDGQLFGIDTLPGMVITQTGAAYTPGGNYTAMDAYQRLAGAWNDPAIRLKNGAVAVLRARYPFSQVTMRAYGRGRKIMPTLGGVMSGTVPFTAQFQAADNIWYSDTESKISLTMLPAFSGGLTFPVTPPFNWELPVVTVQNTVLNTGALPAWPVISFFGPVSNPSVTIVNTPVTLTYQGNLGVHDVVVIDTRPWARTATLNTSASAAGSLSGDPMISFQIQPGATTLHYSGQDPTGTSHCDVAWRSAFAMIGGSLS